MNAIKTVRAPMARQTSKAPIRSRRPARVLVCRSPESQSPRDRSSGFFIMLPIAFHGETTPWCPSVRGCTPSRSLVTEDRSWLLRCRVVACRRELGPLVEEPTHCRQDHEEPREQEHTLPDG